MPPVATPASATKVPSSSAERGLGLDLQSENATYRRFVSEAIAEHQAGRWAEARALFLRAHELEPSARTLRALGMTAFELREYPDAVRELSASLLHPRAPLSAAQQRRVLTLLERADAFVGRYRIEIEPAHAGIEVNGLPVASEPDGSVYLALGRQLVSAHANGYQSAQKALVVNGSDGQTLSFRLQPLWWARGALPPDVQASSEAATPLPGSWQARLDSATDQGHGPATSALKQPRNALTSSPSDFRAYPWTWVTGVSAVILASTALAFHYRDDAGSDASHRRDLWGGAAFGASIGLASSALIIYLLEERAVTDGKQ